MKRPNSPGREPGEGPGHRFTRRELLTLRTYPRAREPQLQTAGIGGTRCGFCGGAHALHECPRGSIAPISRLRRPTRTTDTPIPTMEAYGHD